MQLARYFVTGVLTTFVNFGVFILLDRNFKINVNLANTISVLSAVTFAYITNKLFVFSSHCTSLWSLALEIVSFFSARALTMLIEVGGVFLAVTLLKLDATISKIILNILVLILNYVFSKLYVFKSHGGETDG